MEILFLCEGDAETRDSFSGISKSMVDHIRARGHGVVCGDVDLYGMDRYLHLALTLSPSRRRWWTRYHLAGAPFRARSRRATALVERHHGQADVIFQIGGTFHAQGHQELPRVIFSDGNISLAEQAAASGQTDAAFMTPGELADVRKREAEVYGSAAAITTISDRVRRSFVEDFGIAAEKVHTTFAGPNLDTTAIVPRTDIGSGPPTVLFVGRQFLRKGGDVLLDAFARVRTRLPDARLLVVGPTTLPRSDPGVELLGLLDKDTPDGWAALKRAYSEADVFCMPSRFEGFAISFLEAMAFGLPCVSMESPWTPAEMIVHGRTGIIAPYEDVPALASALEGLLSDRPRALEMGADGRARLEAFYTWDVVVDRIVEVLEAAVGGAHGERPPRSSR